MKTSTFEGWDSFADRLRRFIISKVKNQALADDLSREKYLRIHSNMDTL